MALEPCLAGLRYVRPIVLGGVERPILRVMRWRARKRDRVLVLVVTPCLGARRSRRPGWDVFGNDLDKVAEAV